MSKERELLERAIDEWDSDRNLYEFHKVMEEIRAYLAEPELKSYPDSIDLQSRCRGDKL